jgi:hypothetical protein
MSECSTLITQHASRTDSLHITLTEQTIDQRGNGCELVARIEILRLGLCLTHCSPEASQVSVAKAPAQRFKTCSCNASRKQASEALKPHIKLRIHGLHLDIRACGFELGANMSQCFGMEMWVCFV